MLNKINFLTAGESHGKGLLGIIEGIPSGLAISHQYIDFHLSRRQKGFGRGDRMKIEKDQAEMYCGIRLGHTIGAPIGLIIKNLDWTNWKDIMSTDAINQNLEKITLPRPGHADLAGAIKHYFDDIRNVIERSSARETTMRVALGTICRKLLEGCNIHIASYVTQIYDIKDLSPIPNTVQAINKKADESEVRSLNKEIERDMIGIIKKAQKNGDTVGGEFRVLVSGVPYGLGSYASWDKKLNAKLSEAICSINAIKGVYFGAEHAMNSFGSELHDEIGYDQKNYTRISNNAGGIEGGMSNAQTIVINGIMKPLSTLSKPLKSIDIKSKKEKLAHKERSDSCAVPAAAIVAESMTCLIIADAILDKFGGDSLTELKQHLQSAKY